MEKTDKATENCRAAVKWFDRGKNRVPWKRVWRQVSEEVTAIQLWDLEPLSSGKRHDKDWNAKASSGEASAQLKAVLSDDTISDLLSCPTNIWTCDHSNTLSHLNLFIVSISGLQNHIFNMEFTWHSLKIKRNQNHRWNYLCHLQRSGWLWDRCVRASEYRAAFQRGRSSTFWTSLSVSNPNLRCLWLSTCWVPPIWGSRSEKEGRIPHLILTQIEKKFISPRHLFLIR